MRACLLNILRTLAIFLCAAAAVRSHAAPALTIKASGSTVTISGVTPHGKVIFFGVARFVDRTTVTARRLDRIVTDDDGDGVVSIDLGARVPWKSIFAAVDYTSGNYALATPDPSLFPLLPMPVERAAFVAEGQGVFKHVVVQHSLCEMLVVRPNVGAWSLIIGEGNKYDQGHQLGSATANVSAGNAVDAAMPPAPDRLQKGDVLLLIDRRRMQSWAVQIGAN